MAPARSYEAEILDAPGHPETELERVMGDLGRVNRWLGGTRSVLRAADGLLGRDRPATLSVLDVGTGGGDIPRAFARWGARRGVTVRALGIDREPSVCRIARRACRGRQGLLVVRADARRLPVRDRGVDLVVATLFLHHFVETDVVALLAEFRRAARRGVIVSDLERSRVYAWAAALFGRMTGAHPMFRHDAPLSVRRGFTRGELAGLAREAGLDGGVRRAWAGRLVLCAPAGAGSRTS